MQKQKIQPKNIVVNQAKVQIKAKKSNLPKNNETKYLKTEINEDKSGNKYKIEE